MTIARRWAVLAALFVAVPGLAVAQGSGGTSAGEFMTYDSASKTVKISLTASLGSANGGMNFNGGFKGDQTITVPVGWSVKGNRPRFRMSSGATTVSGIASSGRSLTVRGDGFDTSPRLRP